MISSKTVKKLAIMLVAVSAFSLVVAVLANITGLPRSGGFIFPIVSGFLGMRIIVRNTTSEFPFSKKLLIFGIMALLGLVFIFLATVLFVLFAYTLGYRG